MKDEIRAGPFIPTVKITEYFTLLSQLSLPPPVAAPRRWKRWRDETDLLSTTRSHTPTTQRTRERERERDKERATGSRNLRFATHIPLALCLFLSARPLPYARLQIYAPRLAALISESSRPAPSVMKEINLLFWGALGIGTRRSCASHTDASLRILTVLAESGIANLRILSPDPVPLSHQSFTNSKTVVYFTL